MTFGAFFFGAAVLSFAFFGCTLPLPFLSSAVLSSVFFVSPGFRPGMPISSSGVSVRDGGKMTADV